MFLEINHLSGSYSFFEERHLSLFESTALNGPTIAAGQWPCLDSSQTPLETQRNSPPLLGAITSDCGHKVSLQTFLKDEALPRSPLLTSLHILSSLL